MTRARRNAPALGVPVVDDIARARAAREADKAARQAKQIAESIAKRDAKRDAAAATCADPETLADHIRRSIDLNTARAVLGDAAERDDDTPTPSPAGAA